MPSNNNSASGLMSEGNFSFFSFSAFLSKDMVGPEEGINAPVKKGSTVKLTIFHSVEVLLKVTLSYINTPSPWLTRSNSFYTNFTNMHFQKVPIPHLIRTMKQKFLH